MPWDIASDGVHITCARCGKTRSLPMGTVLEDWAWALGSGKGFRTFCTYTCFRAAEREDMDRLEQMRAASPEKQLTDRNAQLKKQTFERLARLLELREDPAVSQQAAARLAGFGSYSSAMERLRRYRWTKEFEDFLAGRAKEATENERQGHD